MTAAAILTLAALATAGVEVRPQPAAQGDVLVISFAAVPADAVLDDTGGGPLPLPLHRSGDRGLAVAGIDAEARPGARRLRLRWPDGSESEVVVSVVRKDFPTERLRVEPKYVEPPAAVIARITAEKERLDALWAQVGGERLWRRSFQSPVEARPSSAFGLQRIFNGQRRSPHNGVDFPVGAGVPVAAANAGRVAVADDLYFTGNTVIVDHGHGLYTTYAHLSEVLVAPGQGVERGDVVGRVGATGRATGPHLHWGARLLAARVDPLQLLELEGEEPHGIPRE